MGGNRVGINYFGHLALGLGHERSAVFLGADRTAAGPGMVMRAPHPTLLLFVTENISVKTEHYQ